MSPDTLTPYERQTLINQYRILSKLDPDNASDYAESIQILNEGYTIRYEEVFHLWEEMSMDECKYVYDVLDMFRMLTYSFDNLQDKEGLTESDVRFRGFDGNNESKRYAFVRYLKDQGLWQETLREGFALNSHSMSTMTLYPRMLSVYTPMWKAKNHFGNEHLTASEIKKIVGKAEE